MGRIGGKRWRLNILRLALWWEGRMGHEQACSFKPMEMFTKK